MKSGSRLTSRSGAVMVLFVMLTFGVLTLCGLVLDLGIARLSIVQMQSAADGAAIRGVRDFDPEDPDSDQQRRLNAALQTAQVFDDDFDLTADARNFGAGPVLDMQGGIGDVNASQTIVIPESPVYDPELELNLANEAYGDMVAGTYDASQPHGENSLYQRDDFTPQSDGESFLVRLRRTNDFDGLDNIEQVSSSGPNLPFLFARGGLMAANSPETYAPRHHGMTVRATAIAGGRKAMQVGVPVRIEDPLNPGEEIIAPGGLPFALLFSEWPALELETPVVVEVQAGGVLLAEGSPIGTFTDPAWSLGAEIVPAADIQAPELPIEGFVPIYAQMTSTAQLRVVGFGRVRLEGTATGPAPFSLELVKLNSRVEKRNTTSAPGEAWALLEAEEQEEVYAHYIQMADAVLSAVIER